ncbi:hypothetical protein OQA88_10496 [Cercophora sp. LCS_1]
MKFLSLPAFDTVTGALNFDTPDCHVTGGCDLYTTKAAGSDKKLYKNIQQSLESQHAALVKFGASLSPPQRDSLAASLNLSRSSPFGSLEEVSNRRTFAYLIATLNASHPDYDFSHVLRPADFKRERSLKRVMTQIDSTLKSVRPGEDVWGPQMWALVDKEMVLNDCTVWSYQPVDDPFDEEEGAIWALHYFFFNKVLKRVCYFHVRGVPVMSHSPRITRGVFKRASKGVEDDAEEDEGRRKRAGYWLGEGWENREEEEDDGLVWNRGVDGEVVVGGYDDDSFGEDVEMESESEVESLRGREPSEDVAGRMEIDV